MAQGRRVAERAHAGLTMGQDSGKCCLLDPGWASVQEQRLPWPSASQDGFPLVKGLTAWGQRDMRCHPAVPFHLCTPWRCRSGFSQHRNYIRKTVDLSSALPVFNLGQESNSGVTRVAQVSSDPVSTLGCRSQDSAFLRAPALTLQCSSFPLRLSSA